MFKTNQFRAVFINRWVTNSIGTSWKIFLYVAVYQKGKNLQVLGRNYEAHSSSVFQSVW